MTRYEIAFSGQLLPKVQPEQVKANLMRLFQCDAQRIEALFSGHRVVIKHNLDQESAEKYHAALQRAGAHVDVCVMPTPIELTAPPVETSRSTSSNDGHLEVIPRDEYMAAFRNVIAPDFGLAPADSDLQRQQPLVASPQLDLSGFTLAPVGSDLGQLPLASSMPLPDISHLHLLD
ncbi:hypothetical protein [Azomonas macrocytogenes]|uniref:Uncharacterized protein n=1 Tax=Azomonas macrocytogenes TaxID=69962 RepID=A0A839T350_AZOMA|nr:hypothetical protein [Azomonas macrocytogenes]MBB3103961.1 hypothetical protein [Azomonas macrocytogenes]